MARMGLRPVQNDIQVFSSFYSALLNYYFLLLLLIMWNQMELDADMFMMMMLIVE